MQFQVRYSVPLLLCAAFLLSACGGGSDSSASAPAPQPESLGLMKITVSGLGTNAPSSTAALVSSPAGGAAHERTVTTAPLGVDVKQISATSIDVGTRGAGGMRYFNVIYSVRNAQFCATPGTCAPYAVARQNLTLLGARTSSNIDDTAVSGLNRFDGTVDTADIALTILPTHGVVLDSAGTGVTVQPGYESLQVYSEDEISGITLDSGATGLLPYGYVVKNVNTPGSRMLPANPANNQFDGQLAFSFKVPLQDVQADDPYSIILIFQVVDDSNTRVTQSVEEQTYAGDAIATARAVTLGSTDLAVLGGRVAETPIGDPICVVRTAGPAGAPTATLVDNGNTATLASTPYNLQFLATTTPVEAGFCTPMNAAGFGTMVVSGSQSGTRTAAGTYTGSYSGGGSNRLSFTPDAGHPYFIGEQVSYTYTTGLSSSPGNTAVAQAFVGSFLVRGSVPSSGSFSLTSNVNVGANPDAIAAGDFNRDGKLDVAVANYSDDTISFLPGGGGSGFGKPILASLGCNTAVTPCGPFAIVAADFNGDGKLDLATANQQTNNVSILFGDGSGNFTVQTPVGVGNSPEALVAGDFNGDGFPDLAVLNAGDGTVSILLNNGSGGFTVHGGPITVGAGPLNIAVGDFNGDGKLDLAVANTGDDTVSILLGDGSGGFTASVVTLTSGSGPDCITVGDFNGDGIPDMATANSGNGNVSVLLGNGDGTFGAPASVSVGSGAASNPFSVTAGDFNGDGKLDVATANNADGTVSILLGNGSGGLGAPVNIAVGSDTTPFPESVVIGDFNGDGKLDLATPNFLDNNISILTGQP